jgi:hypothetical protein
MPHLRQRSGHREALGQVTIRLPQETLNLLGSPTLAHRSLRGLACRELPYQLNQLLGRSPR